MIDLKTKATNAHCYAILQILLSCEFNYKYIARSKYERKIQILDR